MRYTVCAKKVTPFWCSSFLPLLDAYRDGFCWRLVYTIKTGVIFIEPGAKVNSSYYCERVLGEGLLPDIRTKCRQYRWTLQQDGAHCKNTLWLYGSRVDTLSPLQFI